MSTLRPFLKWAGAKTKLVKHIEPLVPPTATRLIEPFLGSGAVALNLNLPRNLLADTNPDVVDVYRHLAKSPQRFIRDSKRLFNPRNNTQAAYNRIRDTFNALKHSYRRACLFVYLNRHGYNGLCRYNRQGGYNVPFGRYDAPYFPAQELVDFHALLGHSELRCADFRAVLAEATVGDFVYCDPPYSPLTETANFTGYARDGFSHRDQEDLRDACRTARDRGAMVVISNHDTPTTRALYADANHLIELQVARLISCDGSSRNKTGELLVVYAPDELAVAL